MRSEAADDVARLEPFPWDEAMTAGLGTLRLAPSDFWSMTPRELDAALRGALGLSLRGGAMTRADLAALIAAYPDTT